MWQLGVWNELTVWRTAPQGLYLGVGPDDYPGEAVLLPTRWVTPEMTLGDELNVFVYKDSEGRPIATTDTPRVQVGQFANLRVVHVVPNLGVFLDWGLSKDLLLPFRELGPAKHLAPGDAVVVAVYIDPSDRLVASARIEDHLPTPSPDHTPDLQPNDQVHALVYAQSPLGFKAIVNQRYSGLLYRSETPHVLHPGDAIQAYVKGITDDGRIDLRRDPAGYQRVESITDTILQKLQASSGSLPFNDKSSPADIRAAFNCSKKAFKQALGQLYKQRKITLTPTGIHKPTK